MMKTFKWEDTTASNVSVNESLLDTLSKKYFSIQKSTFGDIGYLGPFIVINGVADGLASLLANSVERAYEIGLATVGFHGKHDAVRVKNNEFRVHALVRVDNTAHVTVIPQMNVGSRAAHTRRAFLDKQVDLIIAP